MAILDSIKSPKDVQSLEDSELAVLASEIREQIINTTSKNGGHIGPNLGVVELTIALHKTFSSPKDSFIFDVSHQGYVHKLLTGRNDERFQKLRSTDGLSGFLNRNESEHDAFGAGHAGTALSAALGMAKARDLNGGDEHIIAVCGDASFTCGITLEALNNISNSCLFNFPALFWHLRVNENLCCHLSLSTTLFLIFSSLTQAAHFIIRTWSSLILVCCNALWLIGTV